MRKSLLLLALGLAGLLVQGTLATFTGAVVVPDLGFLVVVAAGLCLRSPEGLLVSAGIGYATDLLSGSLLGQHAVLRVLAFAATRFANLQLNLVRPFPRIVFVAALTVADGLALLELTLLFGGNAALDLGFARDLLLHAALNALLAPPIIALVQRTAARVSGEEEAMRRPLPLEFRRGGA